jgi:hypothetical protein
MAGKWATIPFAPCHALQILEKLLYLVLVFGYVITAWLFATLSTFRVVSGIDGPALRAGIVFPDVFKPMFIACGLNLF